MRAGMPAVQGTVEVNLDPYLLRDIGVCKPVDPREEAFTLAERSGVGRGV